MVAFAAQTGLTDHSDPRLRVKREGEDVLFVQEILVLLFQVGDIDVEVVEQNGSVSPKNVTVPSPVRGKGKILPGPVRFIVLVVRVSVFRLGRPTGKVPRLHSDAAILAP